MQLAAKLDCQKSRKACDESKLGLKFAHHRITANTWCAWRKRALSLFWSRGREEEFRKRTDPKKKKKKTKKVLILF